MLVIMKTKKYKWLLWANIVTVAASLIVMLFLSLVLGDGAGYAAVLFIPLFLALWIVLIIDVVIGIKILLRKLTAKA